MSTYKRKLLIKIIAILVVFVASITFVGIIQVSLGKKISFFTEYQQDFENRGTVFNDMIRVNLPSTDDYDRLYAELEVAAGKFPGFIGMGKLHREPKVVSDIFYGDINFTPTFKESQKDGLYSFELDSSSVVGVKHFDSDTSSDVLYDSLILDDNMIDRGWVMLREGDFFRASDVKEGSDVPVIVSEGFGFKVGDKLRLTLKGDNLSSTNEPPATITAYVKGICTNNIRIPFRKPEYMLFDPSYQKKSEIIFIPDISFMYTPGVQYETFEPAYLIINDYFDKGNRENILPELGKYGVINEASGSISDMDFGPVMDFTYSEIPNYRILSYFLYGAMAVLCVLTVPSLVMLFRRWKDNDKCN